MTRLVALAAIAALATPLEGQLAALEPGARVRIETQAMQQLETPGRKIVASEQGPGSGRTKTGIEVRGGAATPLGKNLWLVEPLDGSRPTLFPTGKASLVADFVAFESGLVVLRIEGTDRELTLPVDGVASTGKSQKTSTLLGIVLGGVQVGVLGAVIASQ